METAASIAQDSYSPGTNIWVKIIIIIQLSLLAVQFNPEPSTNGDNAVYYVLGKSLADGTGYRRMHEAAMPVESSYPVLFPVFIAITQFFFDNPVFPQICMGVLGALITLLCYYLFRRTLPPGLLLPLLILVASSRLLMEYQITLMTETPYVVLTLAALLLLRKSLDNPKSRVWFWSAIAVSVMPVHCRTVGIAFCAAWIVGTLTAKQYRYAIAHAVLAAITIGAYVLLTPGTNAYAREGPLLNIYDPEMGTITSQDLVMRVMENIKIHAGILFPKAFVYFNNRPPLPILMTLFQLPSVFALFGWARGLFGRDRIISLYCLLYTCIIISWSIVSERRLVCILPFLLYFMIVGLRMAIDAIRMAGGFSWQRAKLLFTDRTPGSAPAAGTIAVFAAAAIIAFVNINARANFAAETRRTPDWTNFYSCADWVRENAPRDAVVMSRKPELVYLRSHHRGMVYPYSHDVDHIVDAMKAAGVRYVIYDDFSWTQTTLKYLYPVIISHPDYFKIAYALKDPYTFVFEFTPK
jgi:hypothetical protein